MIMKKLLLLSTLLTSNSILYAQNTFPTQGNVGIGTNTPTSSLHIRKGVLNGDIKLEGGRLIAGNVNDELVDGQYRAKILTDGAFFMKTNDIAFLFVQQMNLPHSPSIGLTIAKDNYNFSHISASGDAVIKSRLLNRSLIIANEEKYTGNDIKFTTTSQNETWASTKLIIKNNGNIGIGTETPDAKLAVNGDIHTKEVRVDLNNWPDYVFMQNYKLPTIKEVELHIKEKGHLINMPSAKTIETDGLKIGEITRLQQEKIEELTLYIIELNKRIETLEKQISKKQ